MHIRMLECWKDFSANKFYSPSFRPTLQTKSQENIDSDKTRGKSNQFS